MEDSLYDIKEYTYDSYINHLKKDCHALKTHQCKKNCGVDRKMSYNELKHHYENDCKQMPIECKYCRNTKPRAQFKSKHK